MALLSRRCVLLGSVSVAALCAVFLYTRSVSGVTTSLQFTDDQSKPEISFAAVRKTFDPYLDSVIAQSEKDFGIKYSDEDRKRIRNRVWDRVQLVFSEFYRSKDDAPR